MFPLKALNLNKINVRTRNCGRGPTLSAKDMFRTMSLETELWIDFTDNEYLKEEVGWMQ